VVVLVEKMMAVLKSDNQGFPFSDNATTSEFVSHLKSQKVLFPLSGRILVSLKSTF
jgi:hypothetical protein